MKSKIRILGNLLQKIALWNSKFSQDDDLKNHIIMLDWVMIDGSVRDIKEIVSDKDYELSPDEYFKKYN